MTESNRFAGLDIAAPNRAENPRAVSGDNSPPDQAEIWFDRMARDYAENAMRVEQILADARNALAAIKGDDGQGKVNSDDAAGKLAGLVVKLRDTSRDLEKIRIVETTVHKRAAEGVDQFFFQLREKLARREGRKTDKAGAADVLDAYVADWMQRKLEAETKARSERERIAREEAEAATRVREEEERKKREAEISASRARKPEMIEAHEQAAAVADVNVRSAAIAESNARSEQLEATIQANAKPADMVRTRTDEGVLMTMAQVPYVQLLDATKVDPMVLWGYVKFAHQEMALKKWADATQAAQRKLTMPGTIIEMRNKSRIGG